MDRYAFMFDRLGAAGEGAFGAFATLGDPDLAAADDILDALVAGGADMLEVKLGRESQGAVEVLSGLKTGETVVTRGSFVLKSEHMKSELGEEGHAH